MPLKRVGIIGLGLIGASLGLALRRGANAPEVVGFDISSENLHRAARQGAITRSCGTLAEVCDGSDVVVLAAPVRAILELLAELAPHVQPNTLVTDVGGTKSEIVRVGEAALPSHVAFVGGHPLAGRLTAGVDQASDNLYQGAVYCLTPSPNAPAWGVDLATHFVETLGAQPYFLTADEHDALLAGASHLPYFASAALVNALTTQHSWPEMDSMAAGGFRSISALVEADPRMWADVGATNTANISRQLDALISQLQSMRDRITSGSDELVAELEKAQEAHRAWLARHGEPTHAANEPAPAGSKWPRWLQH